MKAYLNGSRFTHRTKRVSDNQLNGIIAVNVRRETGFGGARAGQRRFASDGLDTIDHW
jgi:hypothetical protein